MVEHNGILLNDNGSKAKNPLPLKKLIPIYIMLWSEAFNSSSIFAYVGYMVLDFGASKSKGEESYRIYAGLLASSFFIAQLFSRY